MADLNELLEEAATRAGELSDEIDAASNAIDEMTDRAEKLARRVDEEVEGLRDKLRSLSERFPSAEGELESATGQATSALDGLASRAESLRGEVSGLLETVKTQLQELEEEKARVQTEVQREFQEAGAEVGELDRAVAELSQAIAANLTEAGEAITAFGATLDQARGELAARQAGWAEAVGQLEEAAEEQAERWTEGLSDLLNGQAEALLAATNQMVATHNETMEDLKQRFAVEAREKLVAALDPLRQELTRLGELSASRQDQLHGRAGEILEKVARALPLVDALQAGLRVTERLG